MEFFLNKKINLIHDDCFETRVLGYHMVLYPDRPSWMFLDDIDYYAYNLLKTHTIAFVLKKLSKSFRLTKSQSLKRMIKLLERIDDSKLYNNVDICEQSDISTIEKIVHINLTNDCNLRCKHCYMSGGLNPVCEIKIEKLEECISDIKRSIDVKEYVISGGEPLVYPNIDKVLSLLKGQRVILFTNGLGFNNKNADKILPLVDEVQISFEGVTKQYYENIRGVNNFEKVMKSLEIIKSFNKKITFAFTVLPSSLDDFCLNLITFLKTINYKNCEVRINDVVEQKGNAVKFLNETYDMHDSARKIGKLVLELKRRGYRVNVGSYQNVRYLNCGIGSSIVINYDGKVYPCSEFGSYHYSINDNFELIKNNFNAVNRNTSVLEIHECKNCELRYVCCGMCKIKNLETNGDMKKPVCDKSKKYTQLLFEYIKQYGI